MYGGHTVVYAHWKYVCLIVASPSGRQPKTYTGAVRGGRRFQKWSGFVSLNNPLEYIIRFGSGGFYNT